MNLQKALSEAYERKWSMINAFTVMMSASEKMTRFINNFDSSVDIFSDSLNLNIISMTTPDFANDPIEEYIANRWVIHNGKDQLYRFSITFRDQDQMELYKSFLKIYNFTKTNYFDDAALTIKIIKDADWYKESDEIFMEMEGCLVAGLSNVSFSNDTENQIAEFTVEFKCVSVSVPK